MGTTFIVMTSLKLAAVMGTGIAISTAFQYFHSYEWKSGKKDKKRERGESDVSKISESVRQRARAID